MQSLCVGGSSCCCSPAAPQEPSDGTEPDSYTALNGPE